MKLKDGLRTLYRGVRLGTTVVTGRFHRASPTPKLPGRLVAFDGFGDNPGRLRMLAHIPSTVASGPLVVLLHGCGQGAAAFAADSGWIELADRLGFPLILPEQADTNNAARCFQWFHPSDTGRDQGEAGSIAAMTRAAIARFDCDPGQVFIVGLSAGGAMAVALLAAYPDLFTAGAAVAGLPVGAARSSLQAMLRMASAGPDQSAEAWVKQVQAVAPPGFFGPWPRLSIWQGQADTTVAPANATLLAAQWRALHGLNNTATTEQVGDEVHHSIWSDQSQNLVELWSVPHLRHAYPVGSRAVTQGRYVEQAPVDATQCISRFFELD